LTTSQQQPTRLNQKLNRKDEKSQNLTGPKQQNSMKNQEQDKAWQNPYWRDGSTLNAIPTSKPSSFNKVVNGVILDDVWILDNLSPPDHAVPPVPPFYQRIFPPYTPPSSPRPTASVKENNLQSTKQSMQPAASNISTHAYNGNKEDDEDSLPYTIDGQGIVRYRSLPSSTPINTNKTVTFSDLPSSTQNPGILSAYDANTAPLPPITNLAPRQSLNLLNYSLLSTQSSPIMLTSQEVSDIENILQLLGINPNAILTIESINYAPTANGRDERIPNLPSDSLFIDNQGHQQVQQLPPSRQNNQLISSPYISAI
jgi:hypothetical protein